MAGPQYQLGNLIWIVDANQYQIGGKTKDLMSLDPLPEKLASFGWTVYEIGDGNDMEQILEVLDQMPEPDSQTRRKPIAIVSNTLKGIGLRPAIVGGGCHISTVPNEQILEETFASIENLRKER